MHECPGKGMEAGIVVTTNSIVRVCGMIVIGWGFIDRML